MSEADDVLTLPQVLERLGTDGAPLARSTFHRWKATQGFPAPQYIGRLPIWPASAVERWAVANLDGQRRRTRPIPASQQARVRLIHGDTKPSFLD